MANLTLSIDEATLREADAAAKRMGMSLNEAVCRFLSDLAGESSVETDISQFRELSFNSGGRLGGWRFNRDEIHDRENARADQHPS